MAEFLLSKGYLVHGEKRRSSSFNTGRVDHLYHDPHEENVRFFLHYCDLTDPTNIIRLVQETQPTEIYNLAAQATFRSASRHPNTPPTPMPWGRFACSRPSAFSA